MSEPVTEFQKAVVSNFQHGRLGHLASIEHYKSLVTRLKREPGTEVLQVILESLRGIDDACDAGARLISAEIDVKAAMASLGALSMRSYEAGRQRLHQPIDETQTDYEAEPEMAPSLAL
ncbi:hypothetical protein ACVIGB_000932 [Bradyrhizobium sp. USDA 4341]